MMMVGQSNTFMVAYKQLQKIAVEIEKVEMMKTVCRKE
jgi:hypothetical protein